MEFRRYYRLSYGISLGPVKTKTIKALDSCGVFVDDKYMGKVYKLNYNGGICYEYRGSPIGVNKYEWIHCISKKDLHNKLKYSLRQELLEARRNFGKFKAGEYHRYRKDIAKEISVELAILNISQNDDKYVPPIRRRSRRREQPEYEHQIIRKDQHAFAQANEPISPPFPNLIDVF